jgi:hypothetical protein
MKRAGGSPKFGAKGTPKKRAEPKAANASPVKSPGVLDREDAPIAPGSIIWGTAVLSLAPFLLGLPRFKDLFFFGDEWDLLSEMANIGLLHWSLTPFAENFAPLFKILWGGAVLLFHGSYFVLLLLLWLAHFGIIATLGSILRRLGFGVYAIVCAMLICGLASSNIESLAWSVQWSPVLTTLFFVLSWRLLIHLIEARKWSGLVAAEIGLYALLIVASGLCFFRGVVSGLVLALFVISCRRSATLPIVRRTVLGVSFAIPIILGAFVYVPLLFGTLHLQLPQIHYLAALGFAGYAFLLNPSFDLASWNIGQIAISAALIFGLFKAAVILRGFSLVRGSRKQAAFLGALLLYDAINCALLGVGRYTTGTPSTVGSRYQYIPLLCLAPFLGVLMQRILGSAATRLDKITAVTLVLACGVLLTYKWPGQLATWSVERGTSIRRAIDKPGPPRERFAAALANSVRAAQLKAKYNLH